MKRRRRAEEEGVDVIALVDDSGLDPRQYDYTRAVRALLEPHGLTPLDLFRARLARRDAHQPDSAR